MFEIIVTARQNCLPANGNLMRRRRHMVIMSVSHSTCTEKLERKNKNEEEEDCLFPFLCKCIRLWSLPSVLSKRTSASRSTAIFVRHVDKHKHANKCTPRCINISLRIFYDTAHPNGNVNMLFKRNKHISLQVRT